MEQTIRLTVHFTKCTSSAGRTPEAAIQALDANYRNYRLIERNLLQSKARQMGKLPEIQKAEEAVALLLRKREAAQEVCALFGCETTCCVTFRSTWPLMLYRY